MNLGCVVLAAGAGTRMHSAVPKVLFTLCGKSLLAHVVESVASLRPAQVCVVVGHEADRVRAAALECAPPSLRGRMVFAMQRVRRGSGHALMCARRRISAALDALVVISGDVPLIAPATLRSLIGAWRGADAAVLTTEPSDPFGYGRIVRGPDGRFLRIVEEKDASAVQRAIREVNAGVYVFRPRRLWPALRTLRPDNAKREYYLTDVLDRLGTVHTCRCADPEEVRGVNTRTELARCEDIVRRRILSGLMESGVTVRIPETVFVDYGVRVASDTEILPGCILSECTIGSGCRIGPYTVMSGTRVGDRVSVVCSHVDGADIGAGCRIGPYARLRPGAVLSARAVAGNFVEVKNSVVGVGSKINHLAYIGDADVGEEVNVGAGAITCNYDGVAKHRSIIGDRSFIGSNVNLVAPIRIGHHTVIAAGSTVGRDVPPRTLVIAREREVLKPNHEIVRRMCDRARRSGGRA